MILAVDVGGTKTVVALFEGGSDSLRQQSEEVFVSREHASLEEILERFRREHPGPEIEAACFGVAGVVIDAAAVATNLPWRIEEAALAEAIGVRRVKLLNDLEAAAYGMHHLAPSDRVALNPSARPARPGNAVVIAAGTGLGEALLIWDGQCHQAVASEGGHVDFAPRTEQQIELLRFLRAEHGGRVSAERVLSGPGFHNLYRFLRHASGVPEPAWLAQEMERGDPSAAVTEAGLAGRDAVCAETLELFASIYGATAGDVALHCVAVGGVFVGGGIAPRILPVLQGGAFMQAFTAKGRFRTLLESFPVTVAVNPRAPILGAAHYAATRLQERAAAD